MFGLLKKHKQKLSVVAPISGVFTELERVSDPVFAQKLMGDGFAIKPRPDESIVYSPVEAKVVSLPESKHAVGLVTDDGDEVLLHIGIDTVNLNGKGFTALVKLGDKVNKGQELIELNRQFLSAKQADLTTIVVLTKLIPEHQNWHFVKTFGTQVTRQEDIITQSID